MNLKKIFKKDPIKVKQPQEYFCSNANCINEIAISSPLSELLTDEALSDYAYFYCIDCITNQRFLD